MAEEGPVITNKVTAAQWANSTKNAVLATIDGIVWTVPADETNAQYREVQDWIAAGNTIADPPAPPS